MIRQSLHYLLCFRSLRGKVQITRPCGFCICSTSPQGHGTTRKMFWNVRSFVRSFVRERFFWGVSKNHQGGTCENLLKIVAINESLHLGSEKYPPYGRAQRLTRPKCAILGKITRHIKTFFGRFQREERRLFYQFLRVSLRGSARLAILKKKTAGKFKIDPKVVTTFL